MPQTSPLVRLCCAVAGASVVVLAGASSGWAQERSRGGVTVFDAVGCPGGSNTAKVTVPFSIEATGLDPFSETSVLFITDKDVQPDVTYGPIPIQHVDAQGQACADVVSAQPGTWKIDVVEPNGFTDSKVVTIVGETVPTSTSTTVPPSPTTLPPSPTTTTTNPTTSSTTVPANTTTSVPSTTSTTTTTSSTTIPANTTTSAPTASTPPTTSPETVHRPASALPWKIVWLEGSQGGTAPLPHTGADDTAPIAVGVAFVTVGIALLVTRRRR